MKKFGIGMVGVALLVCTAGVCAEVALNPGQGYVDFTKLGILEDKEPTVSVSLVKPLLRLVSVVSTVVDSDISALLGDVDHVQVKVFDRLNGDTRPNADAFLASLSAQGWHPRVEVKEEKEHVNVLIQTEEENITGMIVLILSGNEVVFVNTSCHINPESTGELLVSIGEKYRSGQLNPRTIVQQFQPGHHRAHGAAMKETKAAVE